MIIVKMFEVRFRVNGRKGKPLFTQFNSNNGINTKEQALTALVNCDFIKKNKLQISEIVEVRERNNVEVMGIL